MNNVDKVVNAGSTQTAPSPDGFREKCGVFGVFGDENVTELIFHGLYALQHRGQQGCGICVSNGKRAQVIKGLGLVADSLPVEKRSRLEGHIGIGHNRYATTGRSGRLDNVQPLLVNYKDGKLAIAHNGNLTNAAAIRRTMEDNGSIFQTTTDSEIVLHLIAKSKAADFADRVAEAVRPFEGALTCVIMNEDTLVGYRDPSGVRPLSLGYLDGMNLLASETCAFDLLGAQWIRDVEPGEMVVLTADGVESRRVATPRIPAQCMFELVYFSRPDSIVFGENVNEVRYRLGQELAKRHPVEADVVIAIPDSSNAAALGYAAASGIPYKHGLIRNHYVGRTFIKSDQESRVDAVRVKFNPVRSALRGKRVVAVDDSVVRGTTSKSLVDLILKAGATEVHFRVASPPVTHPCHYGINTPSRHELIASQKNADEICEYIGAQSLGYLTLDDLATAVTAPNKYCLACWTGDYPIPVPEAAGSVPFDLD